MDISFVMFIVRYTLRITQLHYSLLILLTTSDIGDIYKHFDPCNVESIIIVFVKQNILLNILNRDKENVMFLDFSNMI